MKKLTTLICIIFLFSTLLLASSCNDENDKKINKLEKELDELEEKLDQLEDFEKKVLENERKAIEDELEDLRRSKRYRGGGASASGSW